ncbi:hypothetical protein [Daejeonia sp. YH14]|uniref:hypothetical protein n=1 Tax=Daejeonia sp. YH14 TaxID=3439042 RepID=UPI003F491358
MTQAEKSLLQTTETRLTNIECQLKKLNIVETFTEYQNIVKDLTDVLKENNKYYKRENESLKAEIKRLTHFSIYTGKN